MQCRGSRRATACSRCSPITPPAVLGSRTRSPAARSPRPADTNVLQSPPASAVSPADPGALATRVPGLKSPCPWFDSGPGHFNSLERRWPITPQGVAGLGCPARPVRPLPSATCRTSFMAHPGARRFVGVRSSRSQLDPHEAQRRSSKALTRSRRVEAVKGFGRNSIPSSCTPSLPMASWVYPDT